MSNCLNCKEYNHEKHYCPKYCKVIRETDKEMREFYKGEHEKLEQIEQIVKQYQHCKFDGLIKIKEILEQE